MDNIRTVIGRVRYEEPPYVGDGRVCCKLPSYEEIYGICKVIRVKIKKQRSCNRHSNCDKAEEELLKRHPEMKKSDIHFSFHCHDDECEDCFGK